MRHILPLQSLVMLLGLLASPNIVSAFEVNVATDYGFDPTDSRSYLQSALDSGASRVIVPNVGQDWMMGGRLHFRSSDQEVVFEDGVVIKGKAGAFTGQHSKLFTASNVSNVTVIGYGATWWMDKSEFTSGEHRHALGLYSVDGFTVKGLTIEGSGGDGIYVGDDLISGTPDFSNNVLIEDVTVRDHRRQGISVISASNLTIRNVTALNTSGTSPAGGLGIEPNKSTQRLENIVIDGFHSEENDGPGVYLYLRFLNETSLPVTVDLNNIMVANSPNRGLVYTGAKNPPPNSHVTFRNSSVIESTGAGIYVDSNTDSTDAGLRFENIYLEQTSLDESVRPDQPAHSPIIFFVRPSYGSNQVLGNVELVNVKVSDIAGRPYVTYVDNTGTATLANVTGSVELYNPYFNPHGEYYIEPNHSFDISVNLHWAPFFDHSFEAGEQFTTGDLAGQQAWYAAPDSGGSAQVVDGSSLGLPMAADGDRLVHITGGTTHAAHLVRAIGPDPTDRLLHVSADLAFGQFSDDALGLLTISDVDDDSLRGVTFGLRNHDGEVFLTYRAEGTYQDLALTSAPQADTFYRFTATIDPDNATYDLLITDSSGQELARVTDITIAGDVQSYRYVTLHASPGDDLYVDRLLVAPAPIPEPTTAALWGVGLIVCWWGRTKVRGAKGHRTAGTSPLTF